MAPLQPPPQATKLWVTLQTLPGGCRIFSIRAGGRSLGPGVDIVGLEALSPEGLPARVGVEAVASWSLQIRILCVESHGHGCLPVLCGDSAWQVLGDKASSVALGKLMMDFGGQVKGRNPVSFQWTVKFTADTPSGAD